jgi:hypothetical protein
MARITGLSYPIRQFIIIFKSIEFKDQLFEMYSVGSLSPLCRQEIWGSRKQRDFSSVTHSAGGKPRSELSYLIQKPFFPALSIALTLNIPHNKYRHATLQLPKSFPFLLCTDDHYSLVRLGCLHPLWQDRHWGPERCSVFIPGLTGRYRAGVWARLISTQNLPSS